MRVGALILFLSFPALCFCADVSGVWGINSRTGKSSSPVAIAVQIEQTGDYLSILTIVEGPGGRVLKYRDYVIHRDVEINITAEAIEIDFKPPAATWIIDSSGFLIIRRCGAGSITLPRSTDRIQ